ncbi:MAG: penicillin-binding protein 2 [Patescibacteria group bacterium]|nr:penicillin-binding protein 2 [Patescibacteria group bacterium]
MPNISVKKANNNSVVSDKRILIFFGIIVLFAAAVMIRLFALQILEHPFYSVMASERQEVLKSLFPDRGSIYTAEKGGLYPLVTNRDYYLIYAVPSAVDNPGKVVDALAPILELSEADWQELLTRLSKKDDPYEPIKHKITKADKEKIEALNLAGIGFTTETYRFYPEKQIGGQIFGFVSTNDDKKVGQYGLEGYFNTELSGKTGLLKSFKDALGSLITVGSRSIQPAQNGSNLVLTIDRTIQFNACKDLKKYYDRFKADSASIIVMEPTGAILAMCNFPDFDPENYREVQDISYFNNPAISATYEPGSVFKMITMAAGLDTAVITPNTTYIDTGEVKVAGYTIRNFDKKARGEQTMIQALDESLNTGMIFIEQKLGLENFRTYVKNFGFGQKTGITLANEVSGNVSSLDKAGDIYGMTASFGQGVSVTPLQLASAYAAVANKGVLTKPYIVSEVIQLNGDKIETKPTPVRQVISPRTASTLSGMLASVVQTSYDKKASVKGYYLAGKTGTAQIPGSNGGYSSKTNHTIAGFGPIANPRFVIVARLENPKGIGYAADSVTPLFSQLAQYLLNYYQIPPDY